MATTDEKRSWEQQQWDSLPEESKEVFEEADVEQIMGAIAYGFVALAHKTDRPITTCVGSLYMSLLSEIQPEFIAEAIKAVDKTLDGPGMEALLATLDD